MIPELGHFALILALALAGVQGLLPLIGAHKNDVALMRLGRSAAYGQFLFVAISYACLTTAFLTDDFSVKYVALHSQFDLPTMYKVSGVWGGHEGSLLLWVLMMAVWTIAVAWSSRKLPDTFASRVLGTLGILSFGFMLFTALTSNPFERLFPAAMDGNDLNPLLQDPGMAIHPPMLYVGYVGFSVAFAFAIAAMLSGNLDREWAKWTRPWTTTAWLFLTVGIALGSWWAYYELGWGGWWFWDAVENASFMPWLIGTALIHSLAVTEKRGLFKSWTLLLALSAFTLSMLGTFLVRSGIIFSVHSFTSDPTRGAFILIFIAIVVVASMVLYIWRAPKLDSPVGFRLVSRDTFLLLNNILLVVATAIVFFGTITPLIFELAKLGKISIGRPWYDVAFLLPTIPLVLLMALGMHSAWREQPSNTLLRKLRVPFVIAIAAAIVLPALIYGRQSVMIAVGIFAAVWILAASLIDPIRHFRRKRGQAGITRSVWGMSIAHVGMGLFVLGVTVVSAYSVEADVVLQPGDVADEGGYQFELRELRNVEGPNYRAIEGLVEIRKDGEFVGAVRPQKRQYQVQNSWMTEAGILARWNRDLFVALGEQLGGNAWSVRVQYKPMIRFIWLGALFMAIGGVVAASDRRYRRVRKGAAS
ncbi:MAG: heme lyase CcmF/NrfE family subunit [Pseudomonadota bacterium]